MTSPKEPPSKNSTVSSIDELKIEKVQRKVEFFNTEYSSDYGGGIRHVPVSLPRVKWLENDPECPYILVSESSAPLVPPPAEVTKGVRRRMWLNQKARAPAPRWTKEEDKLILSMKKSRLSAEDMAIKCGRSCKAVKQRLRVLALEKEKNKKA